MTGAAAAFWRSYVTTLPADHPHRTARVDAFAFGDSPALAEQLAALVVAGQKRATASLPIQFEADGAPLPKAGDVSIVTLGDGTPVAIIETTDVRLVEFGAVDAAFAAAEGEGDRSLTWWRAAHTAYFGRLLARLGGELKDTSLVVCERFRLVQGQRHQ
ncbi:MAG: hypothetical protein AUH76_14790 [Candidatus Rokubacteria bacterium 13_1_40CM_4_67_11]|nr:MAG: hypothetical protein AUH76_14790 [Candidatus Rokubacteria bacterium 13_1_40CM_4_67_11]